MLIFWNMAGVPLSYCHCTLYLANNLSTASTWHHPSLRTPTLIFLFTSYLLIYVTIPFLCLDSFRFLDFAAMCFPSCVSSSSVLNLRTKTHTNLL
jgi:hypothetical protein